MIDDGVLIVKPMVNLFLFFELKYVNDFCC